MEIVCTVGREDCARFRNLELCPIYLEKDLYYYLDRDPSHRIIEEIGIGTNEGIKELYPVNAGFIERHPGLHLGLGGKEKGSVHMDFISCDSQIAFDNQMIFDDRFLI